MDFKELNNKSESELRKLLDEKREALRAARFKASNDQLKDVRTIRELRTDIAQLFTRLHQPTIDKK